jgi:Protein of unknown function (DUF444).
MGLKDDIERYREVGEEKRQDLSEFIQYGDMGQSLPDEVKIPIKIVDLPEFAYDQRDMGGVGQGDGDTPDVGQPVGEPEPQPGEEGDEEGEPGEEGGEHEYYEMDPEESPRNSTNSWDWTSIRRGRKSSRRRRATTRTSPAPVPRRRWTSNGCSRRG